MAFWPKKPEAPASAPAKLDNSTTAQVATPNGSAPSAMGTQLNSGGAPPPQQAQLSDDQLKQRATASKMLAAALGEIVTLMMRTPVHKTKTLQDVENLVLPALMTGQYSIAEAQSKTNGIVQPLAVVLWARVSNDVANRLSSNSDLPVSLASQEWACGDIIWIVEALGDAKVVQSMLQRMIQSTWSGKTVKLKVRDKDGKVVTSELRSGTSG